MSNFLLTNEYRVSRAQETINGINTHNFYFFVGDYTLHSNSEVQEANNTNYSTYYDVFNKMIMGKLVKPTNVCLGIKNIPYEGDLVYTQYDDMIDLTDANYYCVVNAESFSHVFKCLHNNHGAISTATPNFMHIEGANTITYQTSDGYIWKYMYTVDDATIAKFGTSTYFPLIANSTVAEAAISGSINIIEVVTGGKLYNNYVSGTLVASDIRVDQNVYRITNATTSTISSFYSGCLMVLTAGTGVGQYRTVGDSFSNSTGNFVRLEDDFTISPLNGTQYEISPKCIVYTDGLTSNLCMARAVVNALSSNSIAYIEVLYPGSDHFAVAAEVYANGAVGVGATNKAVVRAILPPQNGHGANAATELSATHMLLTFTLDTSEDDTILTTNKFQQIGLVKDPIFANTEINLSGATRFFDLGETVYDVTLAKVNDEVVANDETQIITDATALFDNYIFPGETVCISNGNIFQMVTVTEVTDNNTLVISSNATFDTELAATATLYRTYIKERMTVESTFGDTVINVSNCIGLIADGDIVVGAVSGAKAVISQINRNGVTKDFETFIQLHKYTIVPIHGTFIPGGTIIQGGVTGLLHSVVDDTTMYMSQLTGVFSNTGPNIFGQASGAEAQITQVYTPELELGRGTVEYIENTDPKTRQADQSETFKIVFSF